MFCGRPRANFVVFARTSFSFAALPDWLPSPGQWAFWNTIWASNQLTPLSPSTCRRIETRSSQIFGGTELGQLQLAKSTAPLPQKSSHSGWKNVGDIHRTKGANAPACDSPTRSGLYNKLVYSATTPLPVCTFLFGDSRLFCAACVIHPPDPPTIPFRPTLSVIGTNTKPIFAFFAVTSFHN